MNKKIGLFLILYIILSSSILFTSGYYITARRGTGGHLYISRGIIDVETDEGLFLILYSELANNSAANNWEVTFSVVTDSEDTSYIVLGKDGHLTLDFTEEEDNILIGDDAEGIGTQSFGPFLVWASADPEFGDLIWDIKVYSRDGKQFYAGLLLQWGYGINPPAKIQGYDDDDLVNANKETNTIPVATLFLTAITITVGGQIAYKRSYKNEVDKSEVFVD